MIHKHSCKKVDGKWVCEDTIEEDPVGDPLYEKTKALAEANPGEIAVGVKSNKQDYEQVDLLKNL